ncbi:MAG: superoxide dismutase [Cu-Zn] [Alphaproteobacteria bacterium]|nr:MAG: superoxide dismutase [Cu-Zn] [Alphaproteobacteria bacterium]
MRLATMLILAGAAVAAAAPAAGQEAASASAQGSFVDRDGKEVGTARLTQTGGGVLIELELRGLEPGEHGFHLHQTGTCDPVGGFESAGSHLALEGQQHGYEVEGGPHSGDLPNQFVGEDGVMRAHVLAANIALEGDASIFDADGAALVVHAGPDDYSSQPSGESGDRVACAVLSPN